MCTPLAGFSCTGTSNSNNAQGVDGTPLLYGVGASSTDTSNSSNAQGVDGTPLSYGVGASSTGTSNSSNARGDVWAASRGHAMYI